MVYNGYYKIRYMVYNGYYKIRYMVYNGYYKVMSNIPKMGQLPTPES